MHGRSESLFALAQRVFSVTPHAALAADCCGDIVEMAVELDDLVVTATGVLNRLRFIRLERGSGGEPPHGIVQTLDPSRNQRMQTDAETDDSQEDRDAAHAELTQ
jgi:hypothetical protein